MKNIKIFDVLLYFCVVFAFGETSVIIVTSNCLKLRVFYRFKYFNTRII